MNKPLKFLALSLAITLAALGCSSPKEESLGTALASGSPERTLTEQLADVRADKSDLVLIESQPLHDDDLTALENVAGLRVLQLDHSDNTITAAGLVHLTTLNDLEHLRIRGGSIGDDGLNTLAKIKTLRIINIPHGKFTDTGLAELAKLPDLVQLRIGSPQVTDAGMTKLKAFSALRQLHLIGVPITDQGLKELQAIEQLESLYIDDAPISDAAWEALFQARPDLHVHINQLHHDRDPNKHEH